MFRFSNAALHSLGRALVEILTGKSKELFPKPSAEYRSLLPVS